MKNTNNKDGTFIEKNYPEYFKIYVASQDLEFFLNLARITWPEFLQPRQFSTNVEKRKHAIPKIGWGMQAV